MSPARLIAGGAVGGVAQVAGVQPDDELTTQEAALLMGLDDSHVRRLCRENKLPHRKIGRAVYLFRRADAQTYMETEHKPGRKKGVSYPRQH